MSANESSEPPTPGAAGVVTDGVTDPAEKAQVIIDASYLGRVGPVDVLLARTSRPWTIGVEAVVVSVGGGPGQLGATMQRELPSLSLESSFGRVTPDAAYLIKVNDSAAPS